MLSLGVSSRHDLLISGGGDGKLKFHNIWQNESVGSLEVFGSRVGLYKVLLNDSESKVMVSGGARGGIAIVDIDRIERVGGLLEHGPSA